MEKNHRERPKTTIEGIPTEALTHRQYEYFLTFVRGYATNGKSPSMRTMSNKMGVSVSSVRKNLIYLTKKGYVIYSSPSKYYYPSKAALYKILKDIKKNPIQII